MAFERDTVVQIVNYPYFTELALWFEVHDSNMILYPFPINIEVLSVLDQAPKEIARLKEDRPASNTSFIRSYSSYTLLYRLGLIDRIDHTALGMPEGTPQYVLTLLGRTALEALKQGKVWDSKRGTRKDLTTVFWSGIVDLDLDDPLFVRSIVNTEKVGVSYKTHPEKLSLRVIQQLAQHERLLIHPQGKRFVQKLILYKLAANDT